jgi:hypothetical protein
MDLNPRVLNIGGGFKSNYIEDKECLGDYL